MVRILLTTLFGEHSVLFQSSKDPSLLHTYAYSHVIIPDRVTSSRNVLHVLQHIIFGHCFDSDSDACRSAISSFADRSQYVTLMLRSLSSVVTCCVPELHISSMLTTVIAELHEHEFQADAHVALQAINDYHFSRLSGDRPSVRDSLTGVDRLT